MRATIIAFIVAIASTISIAQAMAPSVPSGHIVSFSVNSDNVRFRQGPGTQFGVIQFLPKGTAVVPTQASDYDDAPEGDQAFYWYRCTLVANPAVSGWIWGKYLSCTLQNTAPVQVFDLMHSTDSLTAVRLYGFTDGAYVAESQSGVPLSQFGSAPVIKQLARGTTPLGTVDDLERGRLDETLTFDQLGYYPSHGYCTFASQMVIPFFRDAAFVYRSDVDLPPMKGDGPALLSMVRDYGSSLLRKIENKTVPFGSLIVYVERLQRFSVLMKGDSLPLEAFFYEVLAASEDHTLYLACFFTRQQDGVFLRTNVDLNIIPGRLPKDRYEYWGYPSASVDSVIDSVDLPTSMVHLCTSGYETGRWDLYVTNGYIFFNLGTFWDGVE
jgi:hypothetical protein